MFDKSFNWVFGLSALFASFVALPSVSAEEFSVTQGYNDGIGSKSYNSGAGTLEIGSAPSYSPSVIQFSRK